MVEALIYLLFLVVGFIMGRMTNKTTKGNTNTLPEVKVPKLNPLNAYKEHKERKELEKTQEEFDTMWNNINVYDGTSNGQQDIK